MRTKFTWVDGFVLVVWLLPLVYLMYVYPMLPDQVALHFNFKGDPDRWGSKREMLVTTFILLGVTLGLSLLLRFLPRIDPKGKAQLSADKFIKVSYALVFVLTALNIILAYSSLKGRFAMNTHLWLPAVGLFFAYMGNLFYHIKPNYFFGIRTPWTLENETVWRKTHELGGRLWVSLGLLLAILTFVLNENSAWIVFGIGLAILVPVPVAYSYFCYRKVKHST
jgi:uncharacterized membrane protein